MKRSTCWTAVLSALLAACGNGPSGGEWAGMVTDSAGVAVVQNPAVGLWGQGMAPTVTEVLRIGVAEGEPEYQFGNIVRISVDGEGQIYVGDSQAQEVRVYDPNGSYLRRIGRAGSGPGELGAGGVSVFFARGDTLVLPDPGQQRVNIFLRDGTFLRSFPIPISEGFSVKWAIMLEGEMLQHVRRLPMPGAEPASGPEVVLRRNSDGAIRDTVLWLPAAGGAQSTGGRVTLKLFDAAPVWELAEDGRIFFGTSTDERIEVRSLDGALERVIHKSVDRQPISDKERELYRNAIRKNLDRLGGPPAAVQMVMQGLTFADHYPTFLDLMAGPEGSVWVQRVQPAEKMAAGEGNISIEDLSAGGNAPDWDVFDRDGRFLGTVTLPPRFRPSQFHANRLYGVQKDDTDVPYAVVLAVSGGFGGDR